LVSFPRPEPSKARPRRFWLLVGRHLREARWRLTAAGLCTLGVAATDLMRPWPIKVIFDHVLLDKPLPSYLHPLGGLLAGGKVLTLLAVASAIPAIAAVTGALAYYQVYFTAQVGNEIVSGLRRELFGHLQRLTLAFHLKTRSGELLTKVASDTAALKDTFTESMLTLGGHLVTVLGVLVIMFALNWKLALVVLATMPVLSWNLFRLFKLTTVSARRQRVKEEQLANQISEVFTTVSLVQAFGRERYEQERFETQNSAQLGETVRSARLEAVSTRAVEIVGAIGTTAVVVVGSLEALRGRLTPGSVLIFVSYLHALYRPMRNLTKLAARLSRARVSARRIGEILDVQPDMHDAPDAVEARGLRGEIVLRDVSFHYQAGPPVLRRVSFRIEPGQRFALVGASGSGKSTLLSLILRLYDPIEGTVTVDGVDLRHYRRESLRASIAVVLQDSLLFGASIRENIAYGKLDARLDEIVEAARAANAHEFIGQLEHGYDTVVGERGARLSGGQCQRIAIARAMIRSSSIVLLDEPMTGLDGLTEAKVHEALMRLVAGKACLLVTHDLQAVADADQVLVLEDGALVDQGRHQELLARSPRYRELCEIKGRRRARDGPAPGRVQTA
jgi:ATP-binding cassette subfamily B protein